MPFSMAIISTLYGAAFGMFPIAWIVFSSIMLYRLAVDTGKFEIIKDSVGGLTNDRRLQAMFIAFSFGAFIEGAAGFGAPVAVSGAMLAGLGFSPFYAAGICLLANTAPVAFGSIGIPITTLANVTGIPSMPLSAMTGRLCAMISVIIPAYLVVVMAGPKRALEVWPAILICGVSFAATQFYVSNYIGHELTDILSSLACISAMVLVLKFWKPPTIMRLEGDKEATLATEAASGQGSLRRVVALPAARGVRADVGRGLHQSGPRQVHERAAARVPAAERERAERDQRAGPAQPDHAHPAGDAGAGAVRRGLHAELAERVGHVVLPCRRRGGDPAARQAEAVRGHLRRHLQAAEDVDGDDRDDARARVPDELFRDDVHARAGAGHHWSHVPVLQRGAGWLGVFLTGSDTSANALFGNLQVVTANTLGLNPVLTASVNSAAGVMGKMISLTSIAVAVAATGMTSADESKLFRFTIKHSILLMVVMGIISMMYAYVFPQYVPVVPPK